MFLRIDAPESPLKLWLRIYERGSKRYLSRNDTRHGSLSRKMIQAII